MLTHSVRLNVIPDGPKLQLADLLAPLRNELPSTSLLSLTNAIKPLKAAKGAPLPAPLPTRVQDRINRGAAYEATKTEVEKWAPTMKRIREVLNLDISVVPSLMHKKIRRNTCRSLCKLPQFPGLVQRN